MKLVSINSKSDKSLIHEYASMYLDLMNLHYEKAALLGIYDRECDRKTRKDAIMKLKKRKYKIILIIDHAEIIGYMRYQKDCGSSKQMITDCNHGVHLDQLYVKKEWRRCGYGKQAIKKLKKKYKKISLECYYQLDANYFYEQMGFRPVITTYLS